MPAPSSFEYAVVRVVPRVEREEFVNAGIVLFCLEHDFLAARVELDRDRVRAIFPGADLPSSRSTSPPSCASRPARRGAGRSASSPPRERFHWLVAPRSTIIQVGPVHSGVCHDPARALDRLVERMVLLPR